MLWDRSGCWSPAGRYSLTQHLRKMPGSVLLVWLLSVPKDSEKFRTAENAGHATASVHGSFWQQKLPLLWALEGIAS